MNSTCPTAVLDRLTSYLSRSLKSGDLNLDKSQTDGRLNSHLAHNPDADYYFLVINKTQAGDVFWTSLKRLPELTPNGNNPPFQCNWSKNRQHIERTQQEAEAYILGVLRQTFVLRAKALESFDSHIPLEATS